MKKVAIGCGIIAGLMMLLLGGGAYYFYSKYFSNLTELAELPALNEEIRDQSDYRPPADRRLTAAQVDQYIRIQRAIRDDLGNRFRELDEKYSALSRSIEDESRDPRIRELLGAWVDVVALIMDAKRAQVRALNTERMSLGEYYWIREQTLMALGYGAFGWNLEALADDPSRMLKGAPRAEAPDLETLEHNRALLQEHEDTIEDWLALSFFGL